MDDQYSTETIIMAAISTLSPSQHSHLKTSISTVFHRHHRRLSSLLSSPTLFSLTLHHLDSISLHHKSQLIGRHLLTHLTHLTQLIHPKSSTPPAFSAAANLRDLDAVLLLLLLCEFCHNDPEALETTPINNWCFSLWNYYLSGARISNGDVLVEYVELVTKCLRFVRVMNCGSGGGEIKMMAASAAAVVALPSREVDGGGMECVICKEEMSKGRDVCELPCNHLFHWMCILPWLSKTNTCPCCRYRLPTDDVSGEIERLWEVLVKLANAVGNKSLIKHLII